MIIILSPSKTMDYKRKDDISLSHPVFIDKAETLVKKIKAFDVDEIRSLLGISESLAMLTYERFKAWSKKHEEGARAAILAFKGDVYQGLKAETFNNDDLSLSQKHIRILSGLYGLLKPLDAMMPHRLEMGTSLQINNHRNLYEYWRKSITDEIIHEIDEGSHKALINLASKEYSDAIDLKRIKVPVIQAVFMDYSSGKYRIISFYAKKARGLMARFIIKNNIDDFEDIKLFDIDGYYFNSPMSDSHKWVFTRG